MMNINKQDKAVFSYLKANGIKFEAAYHGLSCRDDIKRDHFRVRFDNGKQVLETDFYQGSGHRQIGGNIATYRAACKELDMPMPRVLTLREHADHFKLGRGDRNDVWAKVYVPYPTAASVLYCLMSDWRFGEMNFYDFCDELGLSTDSRQAEADHDAMGRLVNDMRRVIGAHREALDLLLEDY